MTDEKKVLAEDLLGITCLFHRALIGVYRDNRFWGAMLQNVIKVESKKAIIKWPDPDDPEKVIEQPTMRCFFNPYRKRFVIEYHPDCLKELNDHLFEEDYKNISTGIIKHELSHILLGHVTFRMRGIPHEVANYAQDMAINPMCGIRPEYTGKPSGKVDEKGNEIPWKLFNASAKWIKMEDGESAERYAAEMMKNKKGGSMKPLDDHSLFGEIRIDGDLVDENGIPISFDQVVQQMQQEVHRLASEAVKEVMRGRGTIPGGMMEVIQSILGNKINWKKFLKKALFDGQEKSREKESTRMRPNRRYGLKQPGDRLLYQSHPYALFSLDSSGSVDSSDIAEELGEINHYLKMNDAIIDVTTFDVEVGKITKRVKKLTKLDVTGRGGTDYNDIINLYNNERRYKVLIIFTDGHCPPPSVKNKKPVIWFVWGKHCDRSFAVHTPRNRVVFMH